MNYQTHDRRGRFAIVALIVIYTLAGCTHDRQWELVYVDLQAEDTGTHFKPKSPVDIESFEFKAIIKVSGPSAVVAQAQRLAVVRSLGIKGDESDDCTGFFVSRKDFLTAKHCVAASSFTQPHIDLDFGKERGSVRANCSRFTGSEVWQDWAICSLPKSEVGQANTLPLSSCAPKPNTNAVIVGFCKVVNPSVGEVSAETALGEPNAGVVELLAPNGGFLPAQTLEGRNTSGCPLDSGGPAFTVKLEEREGLLFPIGAVRVVGIISQIGKCPEGEKRTCIAPTTDKIFLDFLELKKTDTVTILGCDE